jgi:3-hydroxymyristoyl/3-hydroxydecanoyl-(acyl carrier protein) dehydratase
MELDAELRVWQERPLWEPGPGTFPVKYGRAVIEQILPHRPPFLFVDAITRIDVQQGCLRGQRRIDADDPVFAGHFPSDPVYPEVLQVEMLAQLGLCLLYFWRARSPAIPTLPAGHRMPAALPRVEIHRARFGAEARPGDGLTLLVRLLTGEAGTACCAGQVRREETVCTVAVLEFHALRG